MSKDNLALWKKQSKKGGAYFTGAGIIGFFNTNKKNPKEPDLRLYLVDKDGKTSKDEFMSLWCNVSKKGGKFLTGSYSNKEVVANPELRGKKVTGFIDEKPENNRPNVRIYLQEDLEKPQPKEVAKNDQPELDLTSTKEPF